MNKKILCFFVCAVFISIAIIVPASSINTEVNEPDDIRYLDIGVYREENEEIIPVHRAEVYIYTYPKVLPQYAITYTDGHLLYNPTVRIEDDVKITAYHEWFGGNTVFMHIEEDDPEIINCDIVLDPSKSVQRNLFEEPRLTFIIHRLIKILNLLNLR